jgi:hypothetical protein
MMFLKCCTWDAVWTPPTIIIVQVDYCGAAILLKVQELTSLWSSIPSNGSSSSSLTTTGMQPLKIASNSRAEDGVSPAGLRQKTDLSSHNTNTSTSNGMDKDGYIYMDRGMISTSISNSSFQIQWTVTTHKGGLNWILNNRWIQKIAALVDLCIEVTSSFHIAQQLYHFCHWTPPE